MTTNTKNPQRPANAKQPPPPSRTWLWILIGVGAVVLLAGVAAVLSAGEDEEVTVGTVAENGDSSSSAEVQPVTVTGAPLIPFAGTEGDPAIGVTAPVMDGFGFDGAPISIGPDGSQKMVVVLAHWCPHCNREVPVINAWKDAGGVPEGLEVVGISTAAAAEADNYPPSKWIDEMEWTWPVMADSEAQDAAIALGVSGYPTMVILDGDGTVLARASGEMGMEDLDAFVDAALASA
jgi:cytochrome c biogenesis protein CcmG/thiol:disulfide interchange protein DsbE